MWHIGTGGVEKVDIPSRAANLYSVESMEFRDWRTCIRLKQCQLGKQSQGDLRHTILFGQVDELLRVLGWSLRCAPGSGSGLDILKQTAIDAAAPLVATSISRGIPRI